VPALPGGVVSTITDADGDPLFVISQWYRPVPEGDGTNLLRDAVTATSRGNRTGALVVDNVTGRAQRITVTSDGGPVKTLTVGPVGTVLTVAQLAAIPPPDGPFRTIQDLAGLSPDPLT
jgi:hypothetical protein